MTEQEKIQIPLTPFAKGGNDSWVSIFILIWYHESVMTVNPENLFAGTINQAHTNSFFKTGGVQFTANDYWMNWLDSCIFLNKI